MAIRNSAQTVHLMGWCDVLRVLWEMRAKEARNVLELKFYTTDELRRLYQTTDSSSIPLRDGILTRA